MSTYVDLLRATKRTAKRAIFEIGGHDGTDTLALVDAFLVPVVAFEPNAEAIAQWHRNVGSRARLVEAAVTTQDGTTSFRPFDPLVYNNIGASSLFEIDFSWRSEHDPDRGRSGVQTEVTVPSLRLDTFVKRSSVIPDVLCLDCQEAELEVVKSLGEYLWGVDTIVSECSWRPTYKGGCSYPDLSAYLAGFGLEHLYNSRSGYVPPFRFLFGRGYHPFDAVFVRRRSQ